MDWLFRKERMNEKNGRSHIHCILKERFQHFVLISGQPIVLNHDSKQDNKGDIFEGRDDQFRLF